MEKSKATPFSGNLLKLLAAIFMVSDHVGVIFFPEQFIFRYIGRLSFPLFAFFIAEGCRYTRNRAKYLLNIFLLAVVFQVVYYVLFQDLYMCIFVTFTLGIILTYLFDDAKRAFQSERISGIQKLAASVAFLLGFYAVYQLNQELLIDYGFFGCVLPLCASIFHTPKTRTPQLLSGNFTPTLTQRLDTTGNAVLAMTVPLWGLALTSVIPMQELSFLSLLLLLGYSGKRGRYKMKYFFYFFYPVHLALLYGLYFILQLL